MVHSFNEYLTERQMIETLEEMVNLTPTNTGLPTVIWMGEVGGQHGPRIKVSNIRGKMTNDAFVVSVSKTPEVLTPSSCRMKQSDVENVLDWVQFNYDILMRMWRVFESGDGDLVMLLQQLKKL